MDALFRVYTRLLEETDCSFRRYLYDQIDWEERLIGIKGAKGVGKTTLLLQHIKLSFDDDWSKAFYVSLDNLWFSDHTLSELVEYLYTHGVTHIFLDEVHRYLTWVREIKNIYDSYPSLHIVFTGSSLLEIDQAEADLSRRLRMYQLQGLSFREYLSINNILQLPVLSLENILKDHLQIAASIVDKIKILPLFEKYLQQGYYPFFLETISIDSYYERLLKVITTVIDNDILAVEDISYETLQKTKRLLAILAETVPYTPNISALCETVSTTRNQLIRLLTLLERAALIRMLHAEDKNLKAIGKPDKILFNNPNLMFALKQHSDMGTIRETFFAAMISHSHSVHYPKQGDVIVDRHYLFEIGGKNKGFAQIRNIPDSYVAADEIEMGFGSKIPLWLFGLMY